MAERAGLGAAGAAVDAVDGFDGEGAEGFGAADVAAAGRVDGVAGAAGPGGAPRGGAPESPDSTSPDSTSPDSTSPDSVNSDGTISGSTNSDSTNSGNAAQRPHGRKFVFECPMRWGDMDSFGHVNNVVYLRYLEQARVEWMFNTAKEAGVPEFSIGTVVARHEIEYKRPLVYRAAPVRIETWVTEIKNGSFTVAYEVRDADCVYATASTVLVPYNLGENRPRRITPQERGFMEQYLIPPPHRAHKKPAARSLR